MSSTILITANWHTGALSQQTISRQFDNNRYVIQFVGYPEADAGETLSYYLLVWMSTSPGVSPDEITPIELNSDQWYISNYFTQQAQRIKFQLCVLNSAGTFEAHSPIYTGQISGSLEHDGTAADIDVSTLFDAYREYLDSLILAAGAVVIDNTLTQTGQAADAKKTGDEISCLKEDLTLNTQSLSGIVKNNFEPINDLTGELIYMMESGYIRVSSGAMTFQENTKNMRTPQEYPCKLKAGDVFTLNDSNYRYQYIYNNGGSTWTTTGWKTASFTVGTDTDAYIIVGTADNTTITDLPALLASVTVTRAFNATYQRDVKLSGVARNVPDAENTVPYTLECGYITVSSGSITFSDSEVALRTPETAEITLSPRDTISVADGYRYQFIYPTDSDSSVWTGTGWKTADWQMPANVFRTGYLVVALSDGSTIADDTDIYQAVTITHTVHKASFEYRDFYDASHRGYQYIAPQSTKAAFSLAKKYGYNTVECDIRLTSDGYMVIHHNEGMPSDSTYLIEEHTLAELQENANMGSYAGETQTILTIDDLLSLCKSLDLNVFIELKASLTDAQKTTLAETILQKGMSKKAFIICNVNDATYIYRANDEYIGLLLNYSAVDSYITGLVNGKGITAIYNQSSNITAQAIQDAHNAGVKAIGWCVTYSSYGYTDDTAKAEILRAINAGIDGMTVDQWTCANIVSDNCGI